MDRPSAAKACAVALLGSIVVMRPVPAMAQQMQFGTPEMQASQSELIHKLLPSVVKILISKDVVEADQGMEAAGAVPRTKQLYGSGFVIDPSGVIATNYHVVDGAWKIDVTFSDGTQAAAHLLKATRLIDVALIKVDVDHALPAVHWGDSDKLQVGDPVFAIGNALGVGVSVSGGLVSALDRDIMDSPYDDFIQTDAALNHGNSGGPLFDMKGDVVGIDTALISPTSASSGVGFAIPSRNAQIVIDRLMNYGWLRPGWIGVKVQQITPDMGLALGMTRAAGSIVANITPGSPGDKAGLRAGDVVLRIGASTPADERALLRAIAEAPIDKDITLGLWRDGREQNVDVVVREWPRSQWDALDAPVAAVASHHHVPPDLGITLAALDDASRARYGITLTQSGIVVTGVAAGTDAALRGLAPGDVILRVQEKTVSTAADAQMAIDTARSAKRAFVLALVQPKIHDKPGPEWVPLRVSDD